mgnify:CR=1 FL=1
MSRMVDWALQYADEGFAVFPLHSISAGQCTCKAKKDCSSPGKHPHWGEKTLRRGVKDATVDPKQIKAWWKHWPNANIGIATGRISGVVVIDIDGPDGEKSLKKLQRQCEKLPKTLRAQTGKGAHLFFRSGGHEYKNRTAIYPGVDIRGDGGYVVAPPSAHIAGKRYRWSDVEDLGKLREYTVDPPLWVRMILTPRVEPQISEPQVRLNPPGGNDPLLPWMVRPIKEGGRNTKLYKLACGWAKYENKNPREVMQLLTDTNEMKCHPPVGKRELRNICRSACQWANGRGKAEQALPPTPSHTREGKERVPYNGPQIKNPTKDSALRREKREG